MQTYITRYTKAGSLYYTDDWRVNHILDILKVQDHFNGIETFWSAIKHWLYHYRGISSIHSPLYLKEVE
jgi:transposase